MVTLTCRLLFSLLGRLAESLKSEPTDCQTDSPSPATPESTLSSVPSESPVSFSYLHTSLAPPSLRRSLSESRRDSVENLSPGSSPTMSEWRQRAPLPPLHPARVPHTGLSTQMEQISRTSSVQVHIKEIKNPRFVEVDGSHNGKAPSIPLPDYETLFPEKRHGVQGHTKWDHLMAEVSQRHRDKPVNILGHEMSVDGPEESVRSHRSSVPPESSAMRKHHTQPQGAKPVSKKTVSAPPPPKPVASTPSRSAADFSLKPSPSPTQPRPSLARSNPPAVLGSLNSDTTGREVLSPVLAGNVAKRALRPPPTAAQVPRPNNQTRGDVTPKENQRQAPVSVTKEAPTAKPRIRVNGKEPMILEDSAVTPAGSDKNLNRTIQTSTRPSVNSTDNKSRLAKENFAEFDPFPSSDLLSKDPWAQFENSQAEGDIFTVSAPKEKKPEDRGMTPEDLDELFTLENPTDPFSVLLESDSDKRSEHVEKDALSDHTRALQRSDSQRRKQIFIPVILSDDTDSKPQKDAALKEETTITVAGHSTSPMNKSDTSAPFTPPPHADAKAQSNAHGGVDPFEADPFTTPSTCPPVSSASTSPEPLPVILEETASQAAAGSSGGKGPLRAWVSPSDVQSVSAQNSNGGGPASIQRR